MFDKLRLGTFPYVFLCFVCYVWKFLQFPGKTTNTQRVPLDVQNYFVFLGILAPISASLDISEKGKKKKQHKSKQNKKTKNKISVESMLINKRRTHTQTQTHNTHTIKHDRLCH